MPTVAAVSLPVGGQQSIPYFATIPDPTDPTNQNKSAPFNLTGYTLRFTLKASPAGGAPYILQKDSSGSGVTIINPAAGTATINFVTADTLNLAPGVYYFDVVAVNGTAQVPLTTGTFTLTERVSR